MRFLLIIFVFLSLAAGVSAQTAAKIKLQNAGSGKITLTRNKTRATVNLARDVAGCSFAGAGLRKEYKDCAAGSAHFDLIDEIVKNNRTYLLISSRAAGNCNVCGQCGATEAFALIWLKLDAKLRVLDKKSVPIEFCRLGISLVSDVVNFKESTQEQTLKLSFAGDVLAVDFEEQISEENSDRRHYEFSHLEYNRKTPEKGFIIKTEKREKSSATD